MKFVYNLELIKKEIYTDQHLVVIHREKKTNDILKNLINILEIKSMEDLKLFLDYFFKRFLFVSIFTCSTAG